MTAARSSKGYKRSWKNLLLNKRYQLQFTLVMVGLSALLMVGLGIWVMREANDATAVAKNSIVGNACPKVPQLVEPSQPPDSDDAPQPVKLDDAPGSGAGGAIDDTAPAPAPKRVPSAVDPKDVATHNAMADVVEVARLWCTNASCKPERALPLAIKVARCDAYVKEKMDDPAMVAALESALIPVVKCEGGGTYSVGDAPPPEHHVVVQIDESSMKLVPELPKIPSDYADSMVKHWQCDMLRAAQLEDTDWKRREILYLLIGTGLVLVVGLAIYGIKMTHKVAGPLFKISLYLHKMRDGRLDKVYNLRKGDQLVDFYDHFKHAHAGVVQLEHDDIAQLKALIAAAKAAGAGDDEAVRELEALLARKEKAVE